MKKTSDAIKKNTVNFFGALGYLLCLFQWFWAFMLYFSVIQSMTILFAPDGSTQVEQAPLFTVTLPDPIKWGILAVITVTMIIITIYTLLKMPVSAVKTSHKAVHTTARTMAPIVIKVRRKKDTKKLRLALTPRLVIIIKLLIVAVPVVATTASVLLDVQSIDYSIAVIVGFGLASLSIAIFVIQYVLARVFRVKIHDLW